MRSKLLATFALSATLLATTTAHAEDTASAPEPQPVKTESRWYGHQTLIADGASLATLGLAAASDSSTAGPIFAAVGLSGYAFGAPIVHMTHGHVARGIGDLAIRLLTPVLGAGVGVLVAAATYEPPTHTDTGNPAQVIGDTAADAADATNAALRGAAYGFLTGAVIAIGIDAAALAHEDVVPTAREKDKPRAAALTVTPSFGPTKNGFAGGLSGTF